MEVSYPPGLPVMNLNHNTTTAMADEMDIDISIDLDPLSDGQPVQSVSAPQSPLLAALNSSLYRVLISQLSLSRKHKEADLPHSTPVRIATTM